MSHANLFQWAPRTERQLVGLMGLCVVPPFALVPFILANELGEPLVAAISLPFLVLTTIYAYMCATPYKGKDEKVNEKKGVMGQCH